MLAGIKPSALAFSRSSGIFILLFPVAVFSVCQRVIVSASRRSQYPGQQSVPSGQSGAHQPRPAHTTEECDWFGEIIDFGEHDAIKPLACSVPSPSRQPGRVRDAARPAFTCRDVLSRDSWHCHLACGNRSLTQELCTLCPRFSFDVPVSGISVVPALCLAAGRHYGVQRSDRGGDARIEPLADDVRCCVPRDLSIMRAVTDARDSARPG